MISRYITLEEFMKRFRAENVVALASFLATIEAMKGYSPDAMLTVYPEQLRPSLRSLLVTIQPTFKDMGLSFALMEITRTLQLLDIPQIRSRTVAEAMTAILNRMADEMKAQSFFAIEPTKQKFIVEADLFGKDVAEHFPSTSTDIEEAGKCLVFERYTACVYHLMRVAEAGLVIIANRIGYDNPKPGWGDTLNFIDGKLSPAKYGDTDPLFKGDREFLAGVSAQLHAVNVAWRQRVSHIERSYSEEEARRIWEATKGLMQHLATKLKEQADA